MLYVTRDVMLFGVILHGFLLEKGLSPVGVISGDLQKKRSVLWLPTKGR